MITYLGIVRVKVSIPRRLRVREVRRKLTHTGLSGVFCIYVERGSQFHRIEQLSHAFGPMNICHGRGERPGNNTVLIQSSRYHLCTDGGAHRAPGQRENFGVNALEICGA